MPQPDAIRRTSFVTVSAPPERVADFLAVFGSKSVPVLELLPVPSLVRLPIGTQAAYFLDLERLTPEQYGRLVDYASERFAIPVAQVERELPRIGFPILAEATTFTTRALEFI